MLFGRDAELARLVEWTNDLASGTGRAVLIEGEPGIGKSSLARAAVAVAEEQLQVFWGDGDELGQALPLQPLLDALQAKELDTEPRLVTIRRLLRGEVDVGADPTVAASEQMLTLMTELCSAAPTVLVVDDLQWADAATISVWEWLAHSVARSALLLIGIVRPIPRRDELDAVRRAVGEHGTIRLTGLPTKAIADLVTTIAEGSPGDDLLQLADGAAGNPLYVTELMEALRRSDSLAVTDSGVIEVTGGPVPDSLFAAIAHRVDFLPREVRTVLQAAALLGTDFLVSDLALVRGCRVAELVLALEEARAAAVLIDVREKFAFRHPLIRTAFYDEIPDALRPAWHQDAARALAEAGASRHSVARQLLQAVSLPGAGPLDELLLDWLADAAPALVAQSPVNAIELLRKAAERSPANTERGAVLANQLADALYRAGDGAGAERVAHRAMAVVADPELLVDLHWTVLQCRALEGRSEESFEMLARALELPGMSARLRARLLVLAARAHRNLGEVTIAGHMANEALVTAEETGDGWAVAWALHVLSVVSIMQGKVSEALPLFDRALEVVDDDTALTDLGLLLQINKAVALGDVDRYEDAIRVAEQVRQQADQSGNLVRMAQAQTALGELLFEVGRWEDAQAEVENLSDEFKDPGATCCDRGIAALIAFHRGDPVTARQNLELAAPSAEKIGNRVIASLTLARSLDHEINKAPAEALAELTICLNSHAEELDEMEDLLPEAARLAAQVGSTSATADIAAQADTLARRAQVPHRLAAAAYCRGLLESDPAVLQYAAERYDEASRPLLRAKTLEAAAIGYVSRGDRDTARMVFIAADDLYDDLGANWDRDRLRKQFRRYNIRRGPRVKHRRAEFGWDSLTVTETRVAHLVANGLSDREIATELGVSPRTVNSHVHHILTKLDVRSRHLIHTFPI